MTIFLGVSVISILIGRTYKSLSVIISGCIFGLIGVTFNKASIELDIALVVLAIIFLYVYMQKTSITQYREELQKELDDLKK